MTDPSLSDFEIVRELSSRRERELFEAICRADEKRVHLTVFSGEISQRPEFRRALKTDRAMLSMLRHQSIIRFLGSGESDGQLFFWTDPCSFDTLTACGSLGRAFSSEDIIEVGWQVCSALQQAHNVGLTHGGISADTVLISDNLQVILIDFGVARWLSAAEKSMASSDSGPALITISALASREAVEKDLGDLAELLMQLRQASGGEAAPAESTKASTTALLDRLLSRITSSNPAQRPASAREFQGRLGEILIGTDDDSMPLVDHRESVGTSKRSIVFELFEPPESIEQIPGTVNAPAGFAWQKQILPVLIVVALIVLITMIAGLLR